MSAQFITLNDLHDNMQAMENRLSMKIDAVQQDVTVVRAGLDGLGAKVDELCEHMQAGFDWLQDWSQRNEDRLDGIEIRLGHAEDRSDCLSEQMDRIEGLLDGSTYHH